MQDMVCDPQVKLYQDLRSRGSERQCVHPTSDEQRGAIVHFKESAATKRQKQTSLTWLAVITLPIVALLVVF